MNENPNPTEGETPKEDKVVLSKAEHEELVLKLEKESQDKTNLVEEIKTLREKKQISEAEAEELKKKLEGREETPIENETLTADKIAEIASKATQEVLAKNSEVTVAGNKELALTKFKKRYKEFHTDNDAGGIKMSALERKLDIFNMNALKSEEEFLSVFEDAYSLMGGNKTTVNPEIQIPTDPSSDGSNPQSVETVELSSKELKIIEDTFGGNKEIYLEQKAKRPDYVEKLIQGKYY